MRLFKFVSSEHNLEKGADSIRIGTFSYYRGMDANFAIADENEGVAKYSTKPGEKAVFDRDNIDLMPALSSMIKTENVGIIASFEECNFVVPLPNIFIFCCTVMQNDVSDNELRSVADSLEKDSWYEIHHPHEFSNLCALRLMDSINIADLPEFALRSFKLSELRKILLIQKHGLVNYSGDISVHMGDGMENPAQVLLQRLFTKEEKYSSDKEYRFAFVLEHQNLGVLNVEREFVDIKTSPFSDSCIKS